MKIQRRFSVLLIGFVFQASIGLGASDLSSPPVTAQHEVVTTYHGTAVHDPYRWLERADAAPVHRWIDAQNAYADEVMSGFADHGAIAKRAEQLALTSTRRSSPFIAGGMLFYLQETPPQSEAVLVAEHWPGGVPRVLVDTNKAGEDIAITNDWPSPDGRMVAVGTAKGGDENTTITFVDVANGTEHPDTLPVAGGGTSPQSLAWDADGRGVTYVRLPLPGSVPAARSQFDARLYHHVLGTPARNDTAAMGNASPIAEYLLLASEDGSNAAAFVYYGDGGYQDVYLRNGNSWHKVLGTEARIQITSSATQAAAWSGKRLLMLSYQDAPRGRILSLDAAGNSQVLVPQQEWAMDGVTPIRGGFLVAELSGPDSRVRQFDSDGHLVRALSVPHGIGVTGMAGTQDSPSALIEYAGWTLPSRWTRYDSVSGRLSTVFEVKSPADYSKVRTWRLDAPSTGSVSVPVTVIALNDIPKDGQRPLILTAYGGYGLSTQSEFIGSKLAWLERGGVFAVANIRGGGEFGDGWHQDGRRANKQHCFDDLDSAAHALVAAGWTDAAHLGITGTSNGGLLMGAEITQHPADFRAVVSHVGIYDMLRAELWPNGAYNIGEYGTVSTAEEFGWLYSYSPLHRVRDGGAYPAVLLQTGENDPRVAPWQSRKFAAALQKATSSGRPILLLTRQNEGHGVISTFSQRVSNEGAELSFFAEELGLGPAVAR